MILLAYPDPGEEKMTTARHIPPSRSQTSLAFVAEIKMVQQPDCPESEGRGTRREGWTKGGAVQGSRQLENEKHSLHLATVWSLVSLMKINRGSTMKKNQKYSFCCLCFVSLAGLALTL